MTTSRERTLLLLVELLWEHVKHPTVPPHILEDALRARGFAWALPRLCPYGEDDLLTPEQIADELGYSVGTIYAWVHRYRLQQVNGRYRWGDIRKLGR